MRSLQERCQNISQLYKQTTRDNEGPSTSRLIDHGYERSNSRKRWVECGLHMTARASRGRG